MNLLKRSESRIRESGIVARDLIIADFTLQFAHQFDLPCKKGINIRMFLRREGVIDVSVLILDLGRNNSLYFCIQENPDEKTWETACIYMVSLSFTSKTPKSNLPKGFKYVNRFRVKRNETGKFKFDRI